MSHFKELRTDSTSLLQDREIVERKRSRSKPLVTICASIGLIFGIIYAVLGILAIKYSFNEFLLAEWLNMRPGLPKFDLWKNPIVSVPMKIYVINFTNAEDFLSGKDTKLKMEEIGPITYVEVQRHKNVVFHKNSTLSYTSERELIYPEHLNEPGILNKTIYSLNLVAFVSL